MSQVKRLVVLFSGEGTNLQMLIDRFHGHRFGGTEVVIAAAITNRPGAGGIARARAAGIPVEVIDHASYPDRESFDRDLVAAIGRHHPDLVVLAGFMRILTPVFTERVRAINLHPSLLPLFKGAHAIEESYASDMKVAGATAHWVTTELDSGGIITQDAFVREEGESLERFSSRVRSIEKEVLARAVSKVLGLEDGQNECRKGNLSKPRCRGAGREG